MEEKAQEKPRMRGYVLFFVGPKLDDSMPQVEKPHRTWSQPACVMYQRDTGVLILKLPKKILSAPCT